MHQTPPLNQDYSLSKTQPHFRVPLSPLVAQADYSINCRHTSSLKHSPIPFRTASPANREMGASDYSGDGTGRALPARALTYSLAVRRNDQHTPGVFKREVSSLVSLTAPIFRRKSEDGRSFGVACCRAGLLCSCW